MFVVDPAPVIVDASAAIELLTAGTPTIERTWEAWRMEDRPRFAPAHFWSEVANGLRQRGQSRSEEVVRRLAVLRMIGIDAIDRGQRGLEEAVYLAERHGLSVYDALYLQLAIEVDGTLATHDRALAAAATVELVELEPVGAGPVGDET